MTDVDGFLDSLSRDLNGREFWRLYSDFCQNIEKVELHKLVAALPKLLSKIENDYMSSEFYKGVEQASCTNLKFAKSLYNVILTSSNEKILGVIPRVLSGAFKRDSKWVIKKVVELLDDANSIKKTQGILSVYYMDLSKPTFETFVTQVESKFSELVNNKNTEVKVLSSIVSTCGNQRKQISSADTLIKALLLREEDEIKVQLLQLLSHNINISTETEFYELVLHGLIELNIELKGAYNRLAYLLQNQVKENLAIVLEFLNSWVASGIEKANNIKLLQPIFNEIYSLNQQSFQKLTTKWLNDDNIGFQLAISKVLREISYSNVNSLNLDKELLKEFGISDIEYVSRKIIGFIYDKDLSTSMLYSIIEVRHDDESIIYLIGDLFVNYLIFNYYSTIDFLNDKKKNAPIKLKKIINQIIRNGKQYYDAYSKLEILKEFEPSEVRLNYMDRLRSKKFNKSYHEDEKNSGSFSSFLTTLHFRSGKTAFAKFDGKYSAHMEPKLISHSTEMPRGEYIDPIGQAQLRLESQAFTRRK